MILHVVRSYFKSSSPFFPSLFVVDTKVSNKYFLFVTFFSTKVPRSVPFDFYLYGRYVAKTKERAKCYTENGWKEKFFPFLELEMKLNQGSREESC